MKIRAQASLEYILLFSIALLSVLLVFLKIKNTPERAGKYISSETQTISKSLESQIVSE